MIRCLHQGLFQQSETGCVLDTTRRADTQNVKRRKSSREVFGRLVLQHREEAELGLVFFGNAHGLGFRDFNNSWIRCFWQCPWLASVEP